MISVETTAVCDMCGATAKHMAEPGAYRPLPPDWQTVGTRHGNDVDLCPACQDVPVSAVAKKGRELSAAACELLDPPSAKAIGE